MSNSMRIFSLTILLLACSQAAAMFSDLYAFGDSLTDSGNAFIGNPGLTEPLPYTKIVPDFPTRRHPITYFRMDRCGCNISPLTWA